MRCSVILAWPRPCFHLCAASPGMVGSAPPFQRLDQFPSIVLGWPLLSAALQFFAFSSSADPSREAPPANRVTSSSLGSGTSMTPNGFRVPKPASDATFSFASVSDFIESVLQSATAMSCADRRAFAVSTLFRLTDGKRRRHPIPEHRPRNRRPCAASLLLQAEGIVDRMGRLAKPAGAGFGDDHVVLEAHAEFAVDADGRFVREGHAGLQHGLVALHQIGPFMHVEADAVAGAMREAGRSVAGAKTGAVDDAAGGDVDILA